MGSGTEGAFDALAVDCPFVFEHGGTFHLMSVGFDNKGYQTGLARSTDLVHCEKTGVTLARGDQAQRRALPLLLCVPVRQVRRPGREPG